MSTADKLLAGLKVAAKGRRTLAIEAVWRVFRTEVRGFTADSEARPFLVGLLDELRESGALELPKSRDLWDRTIEPPLPAWIKLELARAPKRTPHTEIAWPPKMAFISDLPHVTNLDELLVIRDFLAGDHANRRLVPVRERSVALFGDEKRLDALAASQFFYPGRLELSDLRCYEVTPPLVWDPKSVGSGDAILVIENLHTYDSFCRWNTTSHRYRAIAYGSGDLFKRTVRDLPRLFDDLGATSAHYFGDLDAKGLAIATVAHRWLASQGSTLVCADIWYSALLEHAKSTRLPGVEEHVDDDELEWLTPYLRGPTSQLLSSGFRAPQELVGLEYLLGRRMSP
jgi:hypothetical protein